ncbi:MaoC family dehydratase [Nitrospinaceae bacterium]|nr:MaoC family dehydratase [Nitrospinaceae bacterium]
MIGEETSILHKITEKNVQMFADLTGDHNPLHMDEDFASKTKFKKRVVHGMLTASYISTVIGTILPGPGALYLYQEINFKKPVWIDDTIEVKAKVIQKIESSKMVVLKINITNQNSEKVLTGKARAVCPPS